ncbi:MAG: Uma2 family endonuclease, partial [candidate division WOR-3 bacterium]
KELIYEEVNGKPIYYKNYKLVIKGKKTLEEVKMSSPLQSEIIVLLINFLSSRLDKSKYKILAHEIGVKTNSGRRAIDIAIFEYKKVKPYLGKSKIIPFVPKIAIEVDTKVEGNVINYVNEKTKDLLTSGAEKVIWIFTKTKIILIATHQGSEIKSFKDNISIIEGITLNLDKLLREEL